MKSSIFSHFISLPQRPFKLISMTQDIIQFRESLEKNFMLFVHAASLRKDLPKFYDTHYMLPPITNREVIKNNHSNTRRPPHKKKSINSEPLCYSLSFGGGGGYFPDMEKRETNERKNEEKKSHPLRDVFPKFKIHRSSIGDRGPS